MGVHDLGGVADDARAWFEANWDPELSVGEWWRRLADSGWGFPTWPSHWYGRGLAPHATRDLAAVRREIGALGPPVGVAQGLAGPTIIAHGTDEQRQRFLPGITGGEVWCQLFSEPAAGSDLAALQTRAVRDGEEWVVNGQKVWTSGAEVAAFGILIARTDPDVPKHRGLTYFIIDMGQPGIEVRPIREMTGRSIFNEVFLTDARVPQENVLGDIGGGWAVALTTLANERTALGAGSFGSSGGGLAVRQTSLDQRAGDVARRVESRATAAASSRAGDLLRSLVDEHGRGSDPIFRQEVARIHTLLEIARYTDLRVRGAVDRGGGPGPEVSVGKLAASQLRRELRDTLFRVCGPYATLWGDDAPRGGRVHEVGLSSFAVSIGGGTDQVQRNIIGERVLGLPAEPRTDKDLPFSALPSGSR